MIFPGSSAPTSFMPETPPIGKPPQVVFPGLFAFPPNRETLGGTAYWIEAEGGILVDCPPWTKATQAFLAHRSVRWLFLTQRDAIASINRVKEIQQALGCQIMIQEQEAYLLPGLAITSFHHEQFLSDTAPGAPGSSLAHSSTALVALWTPGFSPGAACLYWRGEQVESQKGVLFTGRHLLPSKAGLAEPLRTAKTFHWPRQLKNVAMLRERFTPGLLEYFCPGASIGFLRGRHAIPNAYEQLTTLNLDMLKRAQPGL